MTAKPFTILLPVRNGGVHVKLCVASILAQTLEDDFELLVLENASTDGTAEWLASLRDERVRVLPAAQPLSIEENWARIVTVPRGEWMTTIGHDDLLDADYLEVMRAFTDTHPDAALYQAHFRLIDAGGRFVRHCRPMAQRETAPEFLAARLGLIRDSFGTGYLMRSRDYDRVGGIPANFQKLIHADDALWMRLMAGSWKATSPRELFSYRAHGSTSVAIDPMILLQTLEQYIEFLRGLAPDIPGLEETLARYGPASLAAQSEELHLRLLRRDLGGIAPYPTGARERLHRLTGLAGGTPGGVALPARTAEAHFLSICARLPAGAAIYRTVRAAVRSRSRNGTAALAS